MTRTNPTSQTQSPPAHLRPGMKSLAVLLTAALLSVSAAACGQTSKNIGSTSQVHSNAAATGSSRATTTSSTTHSYLESDGDGDKDDNNRYFMAEHTDTLLPSAYGKEAAQADKRAVVALIKRYYTAAAAGDGATACPLLYSTLAAGLAKGQGQSVQSSSGGACPAVVSLLFKQQHELLAADDIATMVMVDVRVKGNVGIATVGFRTMPVGQIHVKRDRGVWKVNALLDTGMS